LSEPNLHHVGIVVADLAASLEKYARSLGARWDGSMFADPNQKVKVGFLATSPGGAQIELVEPDAPDAPVQRFLAERGGGLHHVCYEVDDLDKALAEMRARGAVIAKRPKPAVAFEGRPIAWVITAEKLLVELLERAGKP
jgi:methylmalonyl-CoA/ethylmalonyl-CoA epimerase